LAYEIFYDKLDKISRNLEQNHTSGLKHNVTA